MTVRNWLGVAMLTLLLSAFVGAVVALGGWPVLGIVACAIALGLIFSALAVAAIELVIE